MENKTYHHGNLKEELVLKTVELIKEEKEDEISMRKLAELCGVSRQAPYSHFESKEDLLNAAREYIENQFAEYLEKSIEGLDKSNPQTLGSMGYGYIGFFKENPAYFDFIYNKNNCKIILTLDEIEGNNKPFEVFRKECVTLANAFGVDKKTALASLVRCWSIVHGAASLVVNKNIKLNGSWEECLSQLFTFKAM